MSDTKQEVSEQALARKKKFLEAKAECDIKSYGFKEFFLVQTERHCHLYFNEAGDIVCFTQEQEHEVQPGWKTYEFDQQFLSTLHDKDINKYWVVTDKKGRSMVQLRPIISEPVEGFEETLTEVEYDLDTEYDLCLSITEDNLHIKLGDATRKKFDNVYPISANVKGKRIFKFYITELGTSSIIYHTCHVSMVELLSKEEVIKLMPGDLRHCSIFTVPVFDKYIRM